MTLCSAKIRSLLRFGCIYIVLVALCPDVRAELPSIRLDRLTPLGGAAGTTVEMQAIGRDHVGVTGLWFDHPGLKGEVIEKGKYRVTIAPDVPEGTYDVRVVGRVEQTPLLEFIGREGCVSDLCGEKLSEPFVAAYLAV